jgi:hypothetical protein
MALIPYSPVLFTGSSTIESRLYRSTVDFENNLLLELMALVPSAFLQVRDHVTIGNHDSKNKVRLMISVLSGLMLRYGMGSCTLESHSFAVDDCSHVLNVHTGLLTQSMRCDVIYEKSCCLIS